MKSFYIIAIRPTVIFIIYIFYSCFCLLIKALIIRNNYYSIIMYGIISITEGRVWLSVARLDSGRNDRLRTDVWLASRQARRSVSLHLRLRVCH